MGVHAVSDAACNIIEDIVSIDNDVPGNPEIISC